MENSPFVISVMELFRNCSRCRELLGLGWRKLHRGGDIQTESWGRLRIQQAGEGDGVQSRQEELQEQRPRGINEMTSLANTGGFA